jgi:hypothetical protein
MLDTLKLVHRSFQLGRVGLDYHMTRRTIRDLGQGIILSYTDTLSVSELSNAEMTRMLLL